MDKVPYVKLLIDEKGKIHFEEANLITYCHGEYFKMDTKALGKFGYSVAKNPIVKEKNNKEHKAKENKDKKKAKEKSNNDSKEEEVRKKYLKNKNSNKNKSKKNLTPKKSYKNGNKERLILCL